MPRKPNRKAPPHWLTARFGGGVCSGEGCNQVIRKGDKVFYFPGTRAILATACGHAHKAAGEAKIRRETAHIEGKTR